MKAKSFYAGAEVWPGGREANYEESGSIPRVVYVSGAYRYRHIIADHKRVTESRCFTFRE